MNQDQSAVLAVIGENADRLCTLELRPPGYSHGVIHPLYTAARAKVGEPLALAAARRLAETVKAGDVVLLTTGAGNPLFLPEGETDGPLGTVALARILAEGLGAVPVILTEAAYVRNVAATAVGVGLSVKSVDEVKHVEGSTAVLPFPADDANAQRMAHQLMDDVRPTAAIAIEKLAPNAAGVTHSATGRAMDADRARVEHLFALASERNVLTIGVGDNGNEIGFGLIQEAVWEHKPFGRVCQCPCGQGLATNMATDVLVVAGTSNWGAYAIEACLAAVLGQPGLIHDGATEAFMLVENVRNGGIDGSTGRQVLQVDGTSAAVQGAFNELFRAMVTYGMAPVATRRF